MFYVYFESMNFIGGSVTLIYLCLGNVAGDKWGRFEAIDISVRTQNFTCVCQKNCDHQWFHVYPNDNWQQEIYIGNIPKVTNVKKTQFIIKLETFDNNTEIQCDIYRNNVSWYRRAINYLIGTDPSHYYRLIGSNETLKDNEKPAVLKYNETQEVSFKCQEFKIYETNLFIGLINTTTNTIETFDKIFPDTIFNKSHNGTVLCCMYYEVNGTADEKWITRHVAKKTVLVYNETVTVPVTDRQNRLEDKVLDKNSSNSPDEDVKIPDKSKQDAGLNNQATIICIVSAVAVVFILLVGTVIYSKCCRKKPKVKGETKVLYADLDFLRRNEPESFPRERPEEESPYAQIVGELRPQ